MEQLEQMPNIGAHAAACLRKAGIDSPEMLRRLGSREAFLRVRLYADDGACLHFLYGLEGAVQNRRKTMLSPKDKAALRSFYNSL